MVVTAIVAGCAGFFDDGEFGDHALMNATDEPIFVTWVDQKEVVIGPIPPHSRQSLPIGDVSKCSTGILVARTQSGQEIARRSEPLCRDDTWIIKESRSPAPS